jgi:lipocalin
MTHLTGVGKFEVSFDRENANGRNMTGNYNVVMKDPDYKWAVVLSCPTSDFFPSSNVWILSRTPELDDALVKSILKDAAALNLPLLDLLPTNQKDCIRPNE